jgi:hypothetical protein
MYEWTNAKLCDVGNLLLAAILFPSPWIFNYPSGPQSQNAWVVGVIIAALSIAALAALAVREEVLNLIADLWLIVSPWGLTFSGTTAMRTNVVFGIVVAVLAAIELILMIWTPPTRVTTR